MPTEDEWKEVEKNINEKEQEEIEKYGIDLKEELKNKKPKKESNNIVKVIKKIPKIVIILFIMYGVYELGLHLYMTICNMKNAHNPDVEYSIERMCGTNIQLMSKNVDEKYENGEYYFRFKKVPEITFKAIKDFGKIKDDVYDNWHKYLFEHWEDKDKSKFIVKEQITEEGFLTYETDLKIDTYDELLEGTETLIRYYEYVEKWNKENKNVVNIWWKKKDQFVVGVFFNINMKKDEHIISIFNSSYETADDMRNNAKTEYEKITK